LSLFALNTSSTIPGLSDCRAARTVTDEDNLITTYSDPPIIVFSDDGGGMEGACLFLKRFFVSHLLVFLNCS
jgi:hypothetical protein